MPIVGSVEKINFRQFNCFWIRIRFQESQIGADPQMRNIALKPGHFIKLEKISKKNNIFHRELAKYRIDAAKRTFRNEIRTFA